MRTRFPGKDLIMKHTPYGYDIVGGAAVINEEQAANLRKLCGRWLRFMLMTASQAPTPPS